MRMQIMNSRIALCFMLVWMLSATSCSRFLPNTLARLPSAEHPDLLDSAQAQTIFAYAKNYPNGTQLALCIIDGDSEKYVGILRRNDSLLYINNSDSVFEIGSISKTFTGTMLAKLAYEGKVDIHEPIKNILPVPMHQSSLNGSEITLVHLANHTSGLPFEPTNVRNDDAHPYDRYSPYHNYDTTRLYQYLSTQLVLQSTPGETRTYSNLGGGLLGHLLTLLTGKSYEELLFESICVPLGMRHTFVSYSSERIQWMVRGRDEFGDLLPIDKGDCDVFSGAGGIKSSARDLVKYLRANMTDTTYFRLSQQPTKQFTEHFSGALGWAPYSDLGFIHQGAFGATGGYTCGVIFERKERVGLVLLTNISAYLASKGNDTEGLCRALYDPLPSAPNRKQRASAE
jgi:CubicO group peptidase (beta-lactamase class C family)